MVTYFYKENKKVSLTPDKREAICANINSQFKKYYKDLKPSFGETGELLKHIFPDVSKDKMDKIPDLYEQFQTYTSAIQQTCYNDYKAIVDIEGLDVRSNNLASAYKASLIYDWYNIDLMKALDKANENWAIKGEAAFYVCWKQELYQQTTTINNQYLNELGEVVDETIKVREPVPVFEGVDVKAIDPHNLFFDKSQVDDWDNCRKIYRDFVPLETILANTSYNLTNEERQKLKDLINDDEIKTKSLLDVDENTKVYGNTIEVLEFEGTFTLPGSTETLRRIEATVIAGQFLAKFQESDKPKSPYIWAAYLKRPDTGRGQSPLKIPAVLNDVQNMVMDLVMQCYFLIANPPFLAPKGAFAGSINVQPGKPVYYSLEDLEQRPERLDFSNGLSGYNMIDFFRNKAQNATGVNQYMQGSMDASVRTASEAAYIHQGASMRMAREAYKFSHNLLYELVRLFALYKKVFDTTDRQVRTEEGVYVTVDEEVRNGNYQFIIGGSQAAVAKEAETNKIFQLFQLPVFQSLAQVMDIGTASQLLKWLLNRLNLQGTDQVIAMLDNSQAMRQYAQQIGIQDRNAQGFVNDMNTFIRDNIPRIGDELIQQLQNQQNNQQQ